MDSVIYFHMPTIEEKYSSDGDFATRQLTNNVFEDSSPTNFKTDTFVS